MSTEKKEPPEASVGLYFVVAIPAFLGLYFWFAQQPDMRNNHFGLIATAGIGGHIIAYFGLYLLVLMGLLSKPKAPK